MCSFLTKNQKIFNRRIKAFTDNMFEVYNNIIFQIIAPTYFLVFLDDKYIRYKTSKLNRLEKH